MKIEDNFQGARNRRFLSMRNKKAEAASIILLIAAAVAFVLALSIPGSDTPTGFAVAGGPAGANITACGVVNESSVLTQNLSFTGSGACLNVNTSNVTLDCQNFTISGDNSSGSIGILVNAQYNVTIKNCLINTTYYGIYFNHTNNSLINNSVFLNDTYGVYARCSNYNNFTYNNFSNPGGYSSGIYLSGSYTCSSDYNYIFNNNFYDMGIGCILYLNVHHNIIKNNIANHPGSQWADFGFDIGGGQPGSIYNFDNTFINNTVSGYGYAGFAVRFFAVNNTFINNTITGNTQNLGYGFLITEQTQGNLLQGNNFSNNTKDIFVIAGGFDNNLSQTVLNSAVFKNSSYSYPAYLSMLAYHDISSVDFTHTINIDGSRKIADIISLSWNKVFVNITQAPEFNGSAEIYLNHTFIRANPTVDINDTGTFTSCSASGISCLVLPPANRNPYLRYSVNHFTTFSSNESQILPVVFTPWFSLQPVYANNNLTAFTNYTDGNPDAGQVFFNWTVNNTQVRYVNYSSIQVNQLVNDTLDEHNFSRSQNVTVYVWVHDGYNFSSVEQNSTLISNSPPAAPIINLTPLLPYDNQDLYCNVTLNSTDLENDSVSYIYLWYNGSTLFRSFGPTPQLYNLLGSGNTSINENWNCTVIPFDSQDNGTSVSRVVTIQDNLPPDSVITYPPNNSDLGKNSFPINISGTASDNINVSYVQISINGTFYNASGNTSWNYSWTPANDGEYQIYSRAVDVYNNTETLLEVYYVEIYTTSNLTNSNKTNSTNLNSDIIDSNETDSTINVSWIESSEFLNVTSQNCDIYDSRLNHSRCYDSLVKDCIGSGWFIDPSNITNVTGNNNNFSNSNVSFSNVDGTNVSGSVVTLSNITSSGIINGSHITNSNISNSHVDFSNITDSTVKEGSYISNSNISGGSVLSGSNATNAVIDNSTLTDSNISDSTITSSTVTGSTLTNVTLNNSNIQNTILNNTIITDNQCTSGSLTYQGTTYQCSVSNPVNLNTIYNPPAVSSGGGGGGRRYQCNDNYDNDGDEFIDWPDDPGCESNYDNDESNDGVVCLQTWSCTAWSDCLNQQQTRLCSDENDCQKKLAAGGIKKIIEIVKPAEKQTCVVPAVVPEVVPQVECTLDTDCQENYRCENNQCLPVERQPVVPEISLGQKIMGLLSSIYSKVKNFLNVIYTFNKNLNQKVFDLTKSTAAATFGFVKVNYSPFIITLLSIAILVAGYFAYRSFLTSSYWEAFKQNQVTKQKAKQKEQLQEASQLLASFIRDAFLAGSTAAQIKRQLLAQGWPENIIDQYIAKIYELSKADIKKAKKIRAIQFEKQKIVAAIQQPQEGLTFYQRPEIVSEPLPQPVPFEIKPYSETKQAQLLQEELEKIEQEIPQPAIPLYEKPQRLSQRIASTQNSLEQLKEIVSLLVKQGRSSEEIVRLLKEKDWPEEFLQKYLQKYFPHLEHISFFKKEVAELEEVLEKLKQQNSTHLR